VVERLRARSAGRSLSMKQRADPDGGEEVDFLGDSSISANCSKIESIMKQHRREEESVAVQQRATRAASAPKQQLQPIIKRPKPQVALNAEKDLMLMYAEQEAGVENVDSIKQKAEMEGKEMEVRMVAGEVVIMSLEEAAIFDEKNEMEKKLSRKLMLLADDDDSDDEEATKKVKAIEREMRKKMRDDLEAAKKEKEEKGGNEEEDEGRFGSREKGEGGKGR